MSRGQILRSRGLAPLLAAEVISMAGAQMTWLALPWFVLTTTGSATRMTLVIAAEVVGLGLLGLPGGRVLARLGARRTMLLSDGLRAPLMLLVPALYWADALEFGALLGLAFALGALSAPYFAAQKIIVPELLGEDERLVSEANALFQASTRTAMLLGPVVAGVLIGAIGAANVLVVDAATYLASVVLVGFFVPSAPRSRHEEPEQRGLRAGLRYLVGDRLQRVWAPSFALGDAAWTAFFASVPVLVVTRFGSDARIAGWLIASFGIGAVIGNAVAYRFLLRRVDGLTLVGTCVLGQALPLWLLPFDLPAVALSAALALSGVANGLVNPSIHSLMTLRIPPPLRPTVMSAWAVAWTTAQPLGLLAAGPVLDALGPTPVIVAFAVTQTVTMAAVATVSLRLRETAVVEARLERAA